MKGLRFTVPLVRLVVPLNRLQSKPAMHNSQIVPSHTMLRIVRIEKPLEALLPKPKASLEVPPPCIEQIPPTQVPKKNVNPLRKSAGARARKGSPRRKKN